MGFESFVHSLVIGGLWKLLILFADQSATHEEEERKIAYLLSQTRE